MKICKRFWISGQVQGVWYRASTREQASKLGISGYARNLKDGRVEVLACGEAKAVAVLGDWLWIGPPHARVDNIQTETTDYREIHDFNIT